MSMGPKITVAWDAKNQNTNNIHYHYYYDYMEEQNIK